METVGLKSAIPVLRCIDLNPFVTVEDVACSCQITQTAATKRLERLRASGAVKSALLVSEAFTTLPVELAIFASVDSRDFEGRALDIEDVIGLADFIKRKSLSSQQWKKIVKAHAGIDSALRIEAALPLSGGGEWDLLVIIRSANADFARNVFVTKYLQHLPGVAKTNTASIHDGDLDRAREIHRRIQGSKSRTQVGVPAP